MSCWRCPRISCSVRSVRFLLIDLFLKPAQRAITHWLSIAALLATMALILSDTDPAKVAFSGAYLHDGIAAVLKVFILGVTATVFVYARGYLRDRQLYIGEFYLLCLVRAARHDAAGLGRQPRHGVSGSGTVRAVVLRAGRDQPRFGVVVGSGDEIFRARRARVGHAAVRHVDDLRRDRHAGPGENPCRWRVRRRQLASGAAGVRRGLPRRRHRLQVRRRAVPHVGAGCLPGRADGSDDLHRLGAEDCGVRHGLSPARSGPRSACSRIGA